ncbi:SusC/RagA family TonB-linked outer membrane protein [Wenyingzhuangia marina]|uniref:TonB-linked outer membrane protein, SusC/RagA family n=1 Tax=Wenyingzhuangia marina TaxID=1195760 RepID=A0A1M5VC43_9FLAO|nr:TonB-dependent receptor [Wenyingzhuangia marina]SHH72797.1 TonB-linked outer membrane protein, SusC/RagA family [Wenyingzhuangia marina]
MKYKLILLFFLQLTVLMAQEIEVKGTVVSSEDNMPLPGVSIVIKGKSIGTITDFDGNFIINNISIGESLELSYLGYTTKIVVINNNATLNIKLNPSNEQLDEVIVTGYTSQKKADITGAVSVVDMDELNKQTEPNPIKALQGRLAGVNISTDGSPSGGNTKINIRGIGTLNNTDPLYVIDGVPTKGGMHELNPNDIQSIQVLKDASSASIYGSRASNGVIIITTKQGKEGKMRLNLDYYSTLSNYANKLDVLNAKEYGQVLWQANINDGIDPNTNNLSYQFNWGVYNGKPTLNNVLVPEYLNTEQTIKSSNTNWYDEISQLGKANSVNLSMSNGSEKGAYMFSLGYYDNVGIVKTTNFKRLSSRINSSYNFFDGKLKIGENFTINRTNEVSDPGVLDPALRALPIIPVRTVDGKGWGGPVGGMNDRQNPVRLLEYNKDNGYSYMRLFGNTYAELRPIDNLTFKTSFGLDLSDFHKRSLQRSYVSGYLKNDQNSVSIEQSNNLKWTWTNTVQYDLKLNNHNINLLAGTEMFKEDARNTTLRKEDFITEDPDYMYPDAGTGEAYTYGSASSYSLLSYFGKATYDYDSRYLFSATIRRDGSSRFGKNNRFGTFPAFSAGWRINKEEFAKNNLAFFSDLKLRTGWGQTGNQEISNEAIYSLYLANYAGGDPTWNTSYGTAYDLSGAGSGLLPSGFIATQTGNDDLKWETTTQTNIGLDFGFFNQRLTGSVDVYKKVTEDILVLPPYLGVIGEGGNRWVNGASMENEGIEFALNYKNNTDWGLKYEMSANLSANRNQITKLPEEVKNNYGGNGLDDNILGRPINSMYGHVADGLFTSQQEVENSAIQPGKGLGRIRYKDLNNDGTIDSEDRTWIGNPNPGFNYGFNVSLGYKNFDLTTFWQGVGDIDVVNQTKYQTDFWSVDDVGSNKGTRLLNAWSPQNPNSTIPALTTVDSNAESRFSTYYIENGSYLKLRVLQLGYTIPKKIIETYKIQNFRVYVNAQNLLTISSSNFTGIDPENPGFGYPLPLTFTLGLNISL